MGETVKVQVVTLYLPQFNSVANRVEKGKVNYFCYKNICYFLNSLENGYVDNWLNGFRITIESVKYGMDQSEAVLIVRCDMNYTNCS